jgi:AraC-like DNA-binding protein
MGANQRVRAQWMRVRVRRTVPYLDACPDACLDTFLDASTPGAEHAVSASGDGAPAASGTQPHPAPAVEKTTDGAFLPSEPVVLTADDLESAAAIISEVFLESRLEPLGDVSALRLELRALRLGSLTVARIGYGAAVRQVTAVAENFHVDTALSGTATYDCAGEQVVASPGGGGLAFSPGAPVQVDWSADCVQLSLVIPPARLELAVEQALGTTVRRPVVFDREVAPEPHVARQWRTLIDLLANELDVSTGLGGNPSAGSHLECFVLASLVLDHRHNYSDDAHATSVRAPSPAVRRAVALMEELPEQPWSVVRLAAEVHLSPRALQEGFSRDLGQPPMAYLRQVRLRRVHEALSVADPEVTSVRAVAFNNGFLHLGRFAATYRQAYGMLPSDTLRNGLAPGAATPEDLAD